MCPHHSSKWREGSGLRQNCSDLLHLSAFLQPLLLGEQCGSKEVLFSPICKGRLVRSVFPRENWNYWEDWRAAQPAATMVVVTQNSTGNAVMSKMLPTVTSSALRVWEYRYEEKKGKCSQRHLNIIRIM